MDDETLSKETVKKVEAVLFGYRENLARLETLRRDLATLTPGLSVHAQQYDIISQSGGAVSDPVGSSLEKFEAQKARLEGEIRRLERWTAPVAKMLDDLSGDNVLEGSKLNRLKRVLELWYFSGWTWAEIAGDLCLSKRALYHWRGEVLRKAARYMGL